VILFIHGSKPSALNDLFSNAANLETRNLRITMSEESLRLILFQVYTLLFQFIGCISERALDRLNYGS
jgi:hypothetical protein